MSHVPGLELQKVKTLYSSVAKLITSTDKIDTVLDRVMDQIEQFFRPENWSLLRLDPAANELFFVIVKGINDDSVKSIRLKLGEGIAGTVAQTGKSIIVADATQDPRFSDKVDKLSGFKTRSILAVPIKFQDTVYGVLELINRTDGLLYDDDALFILETIGDFTAIAFVNALQFENIVSMSRLDPLTGAYNRAMLEELIADWSTNKVRRRADDFEFVSVALIDVNEFKVINDTQGHRVGDTLLRESAKAAIDAIRKEDWFFRIGGDEFLMIVTHSNIQQSQLPDLDQGVRDKLAKLSKESTNPAGFSYGVVSGRRSEVKELMHQADLVMYDYKKKLKASRQK